MMKLVLSEWQLIRGMKDLTMTPLMISLSDWRARHGSNSHISHITECGEHTAKRVSMSDTHSTQTHEFDTHFLLQWVLEKRLFASINPSCDFQNVQLLCWPEQGYFLPQLACQQGIFLYCLRTNLNGAFSGVFSGTFMEEWGGYPYQISVFQSLRKHCFGQQRHARIETHTHTCTNTDQHSLRLTPTSESSAFQLTVISPIVSQQTGSHYKRLAVISHRSSSSRHCYTGCKGMGLNTSKRQMEQKCPINFIEL